MKAVSNTFKLQTLKLSQFQLGLDLQFYLQQSFKQIQEMFSGFGYVDQATFKDFEGKTSA